MICKKQKYNLAFDPQNKFMWPGFGDNIRVLDWVLKRIESDNPRDAVSTEIGMIPKKDSFNLDGLENINWDELFRVDRPFWAQEVRCYFVSIISITTNIKTLPYSNNG